MFVISGSSASGIYITKGFLLYITSKIIDEKSVTAKLVFLRHSEISF